MGRFSVERFGVVGMGLVSDSIARVAGKRHPGVESIGFDAIDDVRRCARNRVRRTTRRRCSNSGSASGTGSRIGAI
ncbi:hypothetical protein WS70_08480 [Burkholderia mayonis]|uniref:Uncharacterized protein n=1 Tax=Burkholderia mayonis TaxID=1385591 RepID=A0A1B4FDU4_9BURK|nr:hypothetical protein WS70_08480 [Burkholderia mayonis]KVE43103.1 hypothetical protein WS69_23835 [Burkholderia sp. BDU5]KVE47276.1 hypothetical protein WS70_25940 [Burkholderia mayonis]